MWLTVAAYAAVAALTLGGIPTRGVVVLGAWLNPRLVSRLGEMAGRTLAPVVAGLAVWIAIAGAWRGIEGGQMPLTILVAAYLWVGWSAYRQRVVLGGMVIAAGEQAAIVLVALGGAALSLGVRWY
ncbi:MAG: hypothetical protein F4Y01_12200 [Gammaproteobacteria bacterium]|nr:hypothetical protein [Gammaproteobacteria bacterium]